MKRLIQLSIPLFAVYLALTGNLEIANLITGVIVALIVSLLIPRTELPPFTLQRIPWIVFAGLGYIAVVAWDVIRGGISTARIVLDPRLPLNPGIIAIPSGSRSELGTALSAHAITLSPGELVVAIDDEGVMYTHCLNVDDSQRFIDKAQSMRKNLLSKMFE